MDTGDMMEVPMPISEGKNSIVRAAEDWIFKTNGHKWSNNDDTSGDNYGSFKAGAEWMEKQYSNTLSDLENLKKTYNDLIFVLEDLKK